MRACVRACIRVCVYASTYTGARKLPLMNRVAPTLVRKGLVYLCVSVYMRMIHLLWREETSRKARWEVVYSSLVATSLMSQVALTHNSHKGAGEGDR